VTCAAVILQCRTALLGLLEFKVCVEIVFGADKVLKINATIA